MRKKLFLFGILNLSSLVLFAKEYNPSLIPYPPFLPVDSLTNTTPEKTYTRANIIDNPKTGFNLLAQGNNITVGYIFQPLSFIYANTTNSSFSWI